jgi:hypothetical protein
VHRDSGWEIPDTVLQLSTGEGLRDVMFLCDGKKLHVLYILLFAPSSR